MSIRVLSLVTFFVLILQCYPVPALAVENCNEIPEDYVGGDYKAAIYSFDEPCHRNLSNKDQDFMAGFVGYAMEAVCDGRFDEASKSRLTEYVTAMTTGQFNANAFNAGLLFGKSFNCNDQYVRITGNLLGYLERTLQGSKFVAGCVEHYDERFSKGQCQCLSEKLRPVYPRIHMSEFSRRTIDSGIRSNGYLGMQITFQCGIGKF